MRCLYIYTGGERCHSPVLEGAEFCLEHLPLPEVTEGEGSSELPPIYRTARRAGAAFLLLLFLLQLWVGLRALYGF